MASTFSTKLSPSQTFHRLRLLGDRGGLQHFDLERMHFHQSRIALLTYVNAAGVDAFGDDVADGDGQVVRRHVLVVRIPEAGLLRFVGEADGAFEDIVRVEQLDGDTELAFRPAIRGDVAQADQAAVADNDGVDVGRLGIVVLGGDTFTVVKGQLVDGVDVSAYERVGSPLLKV